MASEVGLRCVENLLSLVEVGSRRNSAFEAKTRQANALLGARGSFLIDQQQAGISGMIEPSRRNIRDQRQAGGPCPGLRREIAIELNVGERAKPAEQVDFKARNAKTGLILGADAIALVSRNGDCARRIHRRQLARMLDPILLARRGNVCGGSLQVAVVGDRLGNQSLKSRIGEDLLVGQRRQTGFGLDEVGVARGPRSRN